MANSTQMAQSISEIFGVSFTAVEVISRALMEDGLRKNGGRGRGALPMDPIDFFHVSLGVSSGIGMKEAPAFVRSVTDLKVIDGGVRRDDLEQWEAPNSSRGMLAQLGYALGESLEGVTIFPTLGAFAAGWIEGVAKNQLPQDDKGRASLEISSFGPHATFLFKDANYDIGLKFTPEGRHQETVLVWERRVVFHDPALRALATAYRSGK